MGYMAANAIKISNLTKTYGSKMAVEELSMNVKEGDIYGFLGPNGAGKSTTIRSILGLIHFQKGNAFILGMDAIKNHNEIMQQVGYMPSECMFYPSMKAADIIRFAADARHMDCSREAKKICDRLEVDTSKKIEALSLGNRKKVNIVCAMQHKPRLFIFDEPTSGLDPLMQEAFFELILEYNKKGTTCFLSSHVLSEVRRYCRNAAIIKDGRLIRIDSVEHLTGTHVRKIKLTAETEDTTFFRRLADLSGVSSATINGTELTFVYTGKINALLAVIKETKIRDLLIEEPSLEETFMHFYMKED
jgi:ABC-2 type transport system ATP-binding protein